VVDSIEPKTEFYITGGEPFVRRDCEGIVEYIKKKGHPCGINTNGALLTKSRIKRLAASGLDYILISLHGIGKTHDDICGRPGTFATVKRNIRFLSSQKKRPQIIVTATITPKNVFELEKIYRLGKDLGVDRVKFEHLQYLNPEERRLHCIKWRSLWRKDAELITPGRFFAINNAQISQILEQISRICDSGYGTPHLEVRPRLSYRGLHDWYCKNQSPVGLCPSIWKTTIIHPDGKVRLCQIYDKKLGNVRKTSLSKIFLSEDAQKFRKELLKTGRLLPGCVRCCHRFKIHRYF
jgi:radical SAM protein with 4Fe4S-binding SPASM domain